jgi:hypothetical protein
MRFCRQERATRRPSTIVSLRLNTIWIESSVLKAALVDGIQIYFKVATATSRVFHAESKTLDSTLQSFKTEKTTRVMECSAFLSLN